MTYFFVLFLLASYYEIISEQNDEPSDAETLSSYSSDSAGDMEDGSEDGDDEDSQTDDKGPHPIDIMDQDTSSLSSTEENVNALNKNYVQVSILLWFFLSLQHFVEERKLNYLGFTYRLGLHFLLSLQQI